MVNAGAFGHVTSAIVCAASSFSMSITSPADFLKDLDAEFFQRYRQLPDLDPAPIEYSEPDLLSMLTIETPQDKRMESGSSATPKQLEKINSKVVVLPDFVDTDAVRSIPLRKRSVLMVASWHQAQRSPRVQLMKSLDSMFSNIPTQTFERMFEMDSK